MNIRMKIFILAGILAAAGTTLSQIIVNLPGPTYGSPYVPGVSGAAGLRGVGFNGNFYAPGGTGGQVVSGANLFTGQPSYSVPLHTLNARGGVAFPLALTFSGPTFPTIHNNNDKAPAGWVGAGWSLNTPFVAVNHKGTRTYSDDVILCNLGPFGGGQVLREPETGRYYVATAPTIRVEFDTVSNGASSLFRQVKEWRFILPGGTRLVFGDGEADTVSNSERYLQYAGGLIVASPYNSATTKPFIYRWDLRRLEDDSRRTGIDFEYEKFQEPLWGGNSYTRESYLKKALWRDEYGNEIQRVELDLAALGTGEYTPFFPNASKTSQKLLQTMALNSVTVFHEGAQLLKYSLHRVVEDLQYGKKGLLDSIGIAYGSDEKTVRGWKFGYRDGDKLLEEIRLPSGGRERYAYQTLDLSETNAAQDGIIGFRDEEGDLVYASDNGDGWVLQAQCDDRFCYEMVRNNKPSPDEVYLRVAHNTGNYFDTSDLVLERTLSQAHVGLHSWQIYPMGDVLLVANSDGGTVELLEWNGTTFVSRNAEVGEAGDPIRSNFGYAGGYYANISVYPGSPNYFLVYRNGDEMHGGLDRRVWVYLKDPETQKWKNLTWGNYGDATCKFDNYPIRNNQSGGYRDPRADTDTCFNWDGKLKIAAGSRMFAVSIDDEDLLYLYALNADGSGFDSIGQRIPFINSDIQEVVGGIESPQNWDRHIERLQMANDYLIVKSVGSTGNTYSRFDFLFYDGETVKRIGELGLEDEYIAYSDFNVASGSNDDRNLWFGPDYFIYSNSSNNAGDSRVEYWARKQDADSVYFQLMDTLLTGLPTESGMDLRISTSSRFFSVEAMPNETFTQSIDPYKFSTGSSWLYRIDDTGGVAEITADKFTLPYENEYVSCDRKAWNMSFSGVDNLMMATIHRGTGSNCSCSGNECMVRNVSFKTNLVSDGWDWEAIGDPIGSAANVTRMKDRSWSLGNRLGLAMYIRYGVGSSPDTLRHRRYFFDGEKFDGAITIDVVSRFIRDASPDSAYPAQVTTFDFTPPDEAFVTEFNHNSLTAQFEYAKVTREGLPGGTEYTQYVDHQGYKLLLDSAGLSGRLRSMTTVNGSGDTLAVQYTAYFPPYARGWLAPGVQDEEVADPWPAGVAMNRAEKTVSRQWADNGSSRTARTFYHAYNDSLEMPLFTVTEQGDRVAITQSLLDGDGYRVKRTRAYDYPASATPDDEDFEDSRTTPLETDGEEGRYAVAATEVEYDPVFRYQVKQQTGWRDPGGTWSDAELKGGPVPDFDPDANTFVAAEVTQRNALGQPLESVTEDGEGNRRYTAYFYGGRASLPIGMVAGARRVNTAILTAENGNVPQRLLDSDSLWSGPGFGGPTTYQHRTGRHSLLATGTTGLTRDLILRDVEAEGFDYTVSAWLYSEVLAPPVLNLSRRHAVGTAQDDTTAAKPVDGPYRQGVWQRWEIALSNAQLLANGMFQDESGDYLRITLGSSGTVLVGDVVARPDGSPFSLAAYNERGQATHTTDAHHRVRTMEYGFAGQPVAVRDARGRIFEQSGFNKAGENP